MDIDLFESKTLGSDKKIGKGNYASCGILPPFSAANDCFFIPASGKITYEQIVISNVGFKELSAGVSIALQPSGSMIVRMQLAGTGVSTLTAAPPPMTEGHMRVRRKEEYHPFDFHFDLNIFFS